MAYSPRANDTLYIDGAVYTISEHPAAPDIPYGQEGRAATVYRVIGEDTGELRALKVFKPRYQIPALVSLGERLEAFANIQGLTVCRRQVITARRNIELVRQHPGLSYAVMMPWITGPTWMETLLEGRELSPEESLVLVHALTEILGGMEERGVAHCDLSGPNVLLPALADNPSATAATPIELVDVEQMYGEDLKRPEFVPGGSAGYAHKTAADGLWNARADRYAGALLISEMLGWCDERVRQASWGESYFDPQEMQKEGSERYRILHSALRERWGEDVARLLEQSWESDTLADCATFGQWHAAIPDQVPAYVPSATPTPVTPARAAESARPAPSSSAQPQAVQAATKAHSGDALPKYLREMLDEARRCEQNGNLNGALSAYREALSMAPGGSGLAQELPLIIGQIEKEQQSGAGPKKEPVAKPAGKPAAKSPPSSVTQSAMQPAPQAVVQPMPVAPPLHSVEQTTSRTYSEPTMPALQAQAQPIATQTKQGGSGAKLIVPIILVALLAFGGIAFLILQPQSRPTGGNTVEATSTPDTQAGVASVEPTGQAIEPQNLSASEYLTLTGHTDRITGLAFSPDGQTTASASADNTVKLWNTNRGEELRTLDNGVQVYSIDFSPDGQSVATGLVDGAVKVWRVSDGALLYTDSTSQFSVSAIAFSPGGDLIAISRGGLVGSEIKLLQASDGKEVRTFKRDIIGDQRGYVNSLVFSPDGETLFSDSSSEIVDIWRVADGSLANTINTSAAILKVAQSRDGQRIALKLADGNIEIHRVATNELERTLTGPIGKVHSIAFSPDGGTLASSSIDASIILWRMADGAQVQTLTGHSNLVNSITFSPDGQYLASGSEDKSVRLWKLSATAAPAATPTTQSSVAPPAQTITSTQSVNQDPSVFLTLAGHTNTISALAYSPDGQIIASGSGDTTVRLWRTDTGEELHKLDIGSKVESLAFSPDGKIFATGDGEGAVKVWKVEDATLLFTYDPNPVSCCVSEVAFSPDGALIAVNDSDLGVKLVQTADGTTFRTFPDGQGGAVSNLLFSPDGQIVYTDANSNILDAWRVGDGAKIELNPAAATIIRVTVLPDKQRIALSLANGSIEIWNIATYEVERTLKLDTDRIRTIAFSPDGKMVATSAYEAIIGLWEVERGTRVGSLARQGLSPAHLAFSPDGQFLASGGEDNRVTLWKVAEGIDK